MFDGCVLSVLNILKNLNHYQHYMFYQQTSMFLCKKSLSLFFCFLGRLCLLSLRDCADALRDDDMPLMLFWPTYAQRYQI